MNKVFLYELDLSNKAMNLLFTHHIFCISELADMGSSELSRLFEGDRQSGHQIEARRMWAVQNPDQYEKALPARKTDVLRFKQCAFPELLLHEKDVLVFRDQNLDQIGISQTALRAVRKCGCITLRDLLRVSMGQLTMNMDIKGEVLHDLIARVREIVTVRSPDPVMPAPKIQPAAPSAAPSASGMNGIRFKRVTAGLNLGTAFAPASPERPVPEKGDEPVFETRKEPAASAAVPHPVRADADFERFSSRIRTVQELLDGSYSRWMSEQGMKPLFVSELAVPAPVLGALHRGGICFLSQLACTKGKKLRRMLKQDHLSANALLKIRETLLAFPDVWASPLDTQ
ncbi:MAG: hypothetical protein HUJ54_08480, partial [Erysipelotrichaceae bacterium]|nr:hypothetical protein [Erysipelotrichaceae bacterium]